MHTKSEGILLPSVRKSLDQTRQMPGRARRRELLWGDAHLFTSENQMVSAARCVFFLKKEKLGLRVPGVAGEHGSAYELRLWSQTVRPRSSPSSTPPGWVSVNKTRASIPSSTKILQGWGEKSSTEHSIKNLAYVVTCSMYSHWVTTNTAIRLPLDKQIGTCGEIASW